jgi:hypothetical protein
MAGALHRSLTGAALFVFYVPTTTKRPLSTYFTFVFNLCSLYTAHVNVLVTSSKDPRSGLLQCHSVQWNRREAGWLVVRTSPGSCTAVDHLTSGSPVKRVTEM